MTKFYICLSVTFKKLIWWRLATKGFWDTVTKKKNSWQKCRIFHSFNSFLFRRFYPLSSLCSLWIILTSLTIIQFSLSASTTIFTQEIFSIFSLNCTWASPFLNEAATRKPELVTVKVESCRADTGLEDSTGRTSREPFTKTSSLWSGFPVLIKILRNKNKPFK